MSDFQTHNERFILCVNASSPPANPRALVDAGSTRSPVLALQIKSLCDPNREPSPAARPSQGGRDPLPQEEVGERRRLLDRDVGHQGGLASGFHMVLRAGVLRPIRKQYL